MKVSTKRLRRGRSCHIRSALHALHGHIVSAPTSRQERSGISSAALFQIHARRTYRCATFVNWSPSSRSVGANLTGARHQDMRSTMTGRTVYTTRGYQPPSLVWVQTLGEVGQSELCEVANVHFPVDYTTYTHVSMCVMPSNQLVNLT